MGALETVPINVDQSADTTYNYLDILAKAKLALETATEVAVSVSELRRYENQPREWFNPVGIKSLRDSIDAGGQTTSGLIRENPGEKRLELVEGEAPGRTRYELIDGERRWRAILGIPAEQQPLYKAKLIVADDDVVQLLISGVANFNREGHTAIETMKTIGNLLDISFPMEQIAVILGISVNWAYSMHGLTKLTPDVLALLEPSLPKKQQLPVTAAIQLSKMEPRLQVSLARRVLQGDVPLAELRAEVVRTSDLAGSPVRVREIDPRKKLEKLVRRGTLLSRNAEQILGVLNDPEMKKYLRSRPTDQRKLLADLKTSRRLIFDAEKHLE
jgi:ParB/RepB/Spo0J family partition protein